MKKTIITLSESQLQKLITESVEDVLCEYHYNVNEGKFKNYAMAGMLGAASLFGNQTAQAQKTYNYKTPDKIVYQNSTSPRDSAMARKYYDMLDYTTNHPVSKKELAKAFPKAYEDRNKGPEVWKQNAKEYWGQMHGKQVLTGYFAADKGENPWEALLNSYTKRNYKEKMQQEKERIRQEKEWEEFWKNPFKRKYMIR